jgi:nucleoside-triphosphatase
MRADVPRVLLTGAPRSGKTTLVRRLVGELQASGVEVTGFTTRELREQGHRAGFLVEAISGESAVLAHVMLDASPQVGRYRVDVPAFERIALPAIEQAIQSGGIVVIDELGQMELYSSAFVHTVQSLFDSEVPLVATVHAKPDPVTDALKRHPGVEVLTVTVDGHDALLAQVTARLLGGLAEPPRSQPTSEPRRQL